MKPNSKFEQSDHRQFNRHGEVFDVGETFSGVDYETGLRAVEELKAVCPPGWMLTQFALRWILMFDAVTCAIPGAKQPKQSTENFAAADLPPLSDAAMATVRRIYDELIRAHVHFRW
jgi:aryl-alcohol dehydrogenase-like predicted oxidoreductase